MYTINKLGVIVRNIDGSSIPKSPGNRDYRKYLAWLDAGNTPVIETPDTPEEIIQAEVLGLLDQKSHRVIFKAFLKLENRIRVLEGLTPLTASEYRQLAKDSYFEEL